jgi:hypothetical protein
MSLASSMKSLVDDITISTKERETFVQALVEDVRALIARYQKELGDLRVDLKGFLASSEKGRKEDFTALMAEIHKGLKEITKWQADVRADTRTLLKEYADDIKGARANWQSIQHRAGGKNQAVTDHPIKKKNKKAS